MKQIDFAGGGTAYLAPELEIVDVATEQGFATSGEPIFTDIPWYENPDSEWE